MLSLFFRLQLSYGIVVAAFEHLGYQPHHILLCDIPLQPQHYHSGGVESRQGYHLHRLVARCYAPAPVARLYPYASERIGHRRQCYLRRVVVVRQVAQKHILQRRRVDALQLRRRSLIVHMPFGCHDTGL